MCAHPHTQQSLQPDCGPHGHNQSGPEVKITVSFRAVEWTHRVPDSTEDKLTKPIEVIKPFIHPSVPSDRL